MYSKSVEIAGFVAISIAIGNWARWEAGLLFAGLSLLFIGGTTNDAAISLALRHVRGFLGSAWHRQLLKEELYAETTRNSPHPSIRVNQETDRWARSYAKFYANLRPKPDRATEGAREPVSAAAEDNNFERLT